jgi:sugar lactone lactonase YvrE
MVDAVGTCATGKPCLDILAGSLIESGAANGTGVSARFLDPAGVALDSAGNAYVADYGNSLIRKISPAGAVSTLAGMPDMTGSANGSGSAASFNRPVGVAVDSTGNVYIGDSANDAIRKITPAGVVSTFAGTLGTAGSSNTGTGLFHVPTGVAIDSTGNVYVADTFNDTIRKITSAGVVSTLAGSAGSAGSTDGTGAAARFDTPEGVAVDGSGNIYVADSGNSTIRKVTSAGVVTTLAGSAGTTGSANGTGAAAQFDLPLGVAVDSTGNIYVTDSLDALIREVTPAGVVSTLSGVVNSEAVVLGGMPQFASPQYLVVSGTALVISDSNVILTLDNALP